MACMALCFCDQCGSLRIREVTDQLQKLFNEKTIAPDICGICKKAVVCRKMSQQSSEEGPKDESKEESKDGKQEIDAHDDEDKQDIGRLEYKTESQTEATDEVVNAKKLSDKSEAEVVESTNDCDRDSDQRSSPDEIELRKPQPDLSKLRRRTKSVTKDGRFMTIKWTAPGSSTSDDNGDDVDDDDDVDYVANISEDNTDDTSDGDEVNSTSVKPTIDFEKDIETMEPTEEASEESTMLPTTRHGTLGVDPELLQLMVPTDDLTVPFKCKFCGMLPFQKLYAFQNHVKIHTGKEPIRKPYKCDACHKSFGKIGQLLSHKKAIHTNKQFKCLLPGCKFTFSSKSNLKSHLQVHSGEKPNQCDTCGQGFASKHSLGIHKTSHTGARPFPCNHCGKNFSHDSYRKSHQRIHKDMHVPTLDDAADETLTCDTCQLTCPTKTALKEHIIQEHLSSSSVDLNEQDKTETKHTLPLQDKPDAKPVLRSRPVRGLSSNIKVGFDMSDITQWLDPRVLDMMDAPTSSEAPFKCKICISKDFKSPIPFVRHMSNTHPQLPSIELPFLCNQCDKRFEKHYNLMRHTLCHTVVRPFTCDYPGCHKTFKCKISLKTHRNTHEVKQHMCSSCGAFFTTSYKLRLHESRVHLGLKPYKCGYCEREFSIEDKKVIHERTHTGEKPYVCDQCGYRCARADYLSKHLRIHTKEKPYLCKYCDECFTLRNSLVAHEKKHHPMTSVMSASREDRDVSERSINSNALRNSLLSQEKKHSLTSLIPSIAAASLPSTSDETQYANLAAIQYPEQSVNY